MRPARESGYIIRRISVAVVCAVTVALTATVVTPNADQTSTRARPTLQETLASPARTTPSPTIRDWQLMAWFRYGGKSLLLRYADSMVDLGTAINEVAPVIEDQRAATARFRQVCTQMGRTVRDADAYFPIPDPQDQQIWSNALMRMKKGSDSCLRNLEKGASTELIDYLNEFGEGSMATREQLGRIIDKIARVEQRHPGSGSDK
jgi:hypothetical protein